MAWDTSKSADDLIESSEYNDLVSVLKKGAFTVNQSTMNIGDGNHVELAKFDLPAGTTVKVHASGIDPAGTTGLDVVVRNQTDATDIYTDNTQTNIGPDLASGGDGDTVSVRLDNTSGSEQQASGWAVIEISSV